MLLHLLEIYRGPESGVETPSVFPIICLHLKSLFFLKGNHLESSNHKSWLCGVAGIPWPRMGKNGICVDVCVFGIGFECECIQRIILQVPGFVQPQWAVDSWSWDMEMCGVCWRRKVIVWEAVMIYVLHYGHCVGPSRSMQPTRLGHTHPNGCDPSFTWWSCFLLTDRYTGWVSSFLFPVR